MIYLLYLFYFFIAVVKIFENLLYFQLIMKNISYFEFGRQFSMFNKKLEKILSRQRLGR